MKSHNLAHIPALDHLRLLAALLVLVFHTFHTYFGQWQPAPYAAVLGLVTEGHTGVALFFVLSGFLFMTIALQSEHIAYGAFMRNRLLRIFPLFLFFFFVAISLQRDTFRAPDALYVLFSNIGKPPTSEHFITGAAWTISVEFTFYLVFPFLARFVRAEGAAYLLRLLLLMAVVKWAAWGVSERATLMFYSTLIGRFDQFLWGMLAALLWQRHAALLRRHGRWLLVVALAALWLATTVQARFASYFAPEPRQVFWVFWGTAEALVWSGVVLAYLGAGIRWPQWLARWLERGGAWSYSLYLWHALVLFTLHRAVGGWMPFGSVAANAVLHFALALPLCLVVAWLSFVTIEQPFLRLRGRYVQ